MRRNVFLVMTVTVLIGIIASDWHSVHAANGYHADLVQPSVIVEIGSRTKVLDLGTRNVSAAPRGWADTNFNGSAWSSASQISGDIYTCDVKNYGQAAFGDSGDPDKMYWGGNENHSYLFRQQFILPPAQSYIGSYLIVLPLLSGSAEIYINGYLKDTFAGGSSNNTPDQGTQEDVLDAGSYLHKGTNTLAVFASPAQQKVNGQSCSELSLQLEADSQGLIFSPSSTSHHASGANRSMENSSQLYPLIPGQNALVAGAVLPFSWHRYRGASYYYLQCWLVRPASQQALTADSLTNFATRVVTTHYNLSTKSMPKGVYHWRLLAANASGAALSGWTSEQSVTLE